MKKFISALTILFLSSLAFAGTYQITSVQYKITGITRKSVLKNTVPVNDKRIFENEDELVNYINDYKQQLENTRCFETVIVDYEVSIPDENDFAFVSLFVTVKDALHFLGMPYPKFSASGDSGYLFNIKLKLKDTNFLGSMKEMGFDINVEIDTNENPVSFKLGSTFNFDTPFNLGPVKMNWANVYTVSYTIGDATPEWNLKTGLEAEYPFDKWSVKFNFYQSFIRNLDYEDKNINGQVVHYGDGTYFVENATISTPIIIQDVDNWGKIYYTPSVSFNYNWDFDGIYLVEDYVVEDPLTCNKDLLGPTITIGQAVSTGRTNWKGNFRNGLTINMSQDFKYNFGTEKIIPGFDLTVKAYKAFKYVGFCGYFESFAYLNGSAKFDDKLRGIREQYFSLESDKASYYACETPAALIFNLDMPIHIFTAYWDQLPVFKKIPHIGIFNMELQISPFIDFALFHNVATNTTFNLKDGFYSAGIEALVFPLRWKGFVVRASVGVDLGKKMPGFKNKVNQEWRSSTVSATEISIGLGLQY